ncbi:ABC transporter permease [Streptomyces sp. B6B3]|uniref:ABC transporter permease n=1 Tax=Streptomyces sp. B6B3 TaxID=3153570 RepID=UPI00325E15AE
MSTVTAPPAAPPRDHAADPPGYRLTGWGIVRSEWTKLWSLRSTWITLSCAAALSVGLGILVGASHEDNEAHRQVDPVGLPVFGMTFAQLAVAVLGVLAMTGEYGTGMIRSSMTAVPRRLPVLWAKTGVLAVVVLAVFVPVAFVTFLAAQPLLAGSGLAASLSDPGVARALLGSGVFTAYGAVLGLTIGALIRRTPGAIGVYVGVVMLLPELASLLPWAWVDDVVRLMPFDIGESMGLARPEEGALSTTAAYLAIAVWTTLGLGAAALLLRRRDV